MKHVFKSLSALLFAAALLFASCTTGSDDDDDFPESMPASKSAKVTPAMTVTGFAAGSGGYDYALSQQDMAPAKITGEFTVYVRNAKPKAISASSAGSITVSPSNAKIYDTTSADPVGKGAYKATFSYVTDEVTLASPIDTHFSIVASFDAASTVSVITQKVRVTAECAAENEAYKVSGFAVSGQNEHVFTLGPPPTLP